MTSAAVPDITEMLWHSINGDGKRDAHAYVVIAIAFYCPIMLDSTKSVQMTDIQDSASLISENKPEHDNRKRSIVKKTLKFQVQF